MWKTTLITGTIFALALIAPHESYAASSQTIDKYEQTCARATQNRERRDGIPLYLLSAISQAESGRWNADKQANIAWPWTVTSGGKGHFFDTKAEAVAEVEILRTQGVTNIDVGCMQVNLFYHDDAFETVEQAFDPKINVVAGARYLKAMHKKTGNWIKAAGAYHSMTPNLARKYRGKVLKLWNKARNLPAPPVQLAEVNAPEGAQRSRRSAIDFGRMAKLNKTFRKRRDVSKVIAQKGDKVDQRRQRRQAQLQSWRQSQSSPQQLSQLADMRRAEIAQRRKREYVTFGNGDRTNLFEQRRKQQLDDWRAKRVIPFGPGAATPDITWDPKAK